MAGIGAVDGIIDVAQDGAAGQGGAGDGDGDLQAGVAAARLTRRLGFVTSATGHDELGGARRAIFLRARLGVAPEPGNASSQNADIGPLAAPAGSSVIDPASTFQSHRCEADMTNAEERLREWQVLYREWSELEHRLHSAAAQEGGARAAELKMRSRSLQLQCASALAALDSAVQAMRQRRARRENIS